MISVLKVIFVDFLYHVSFIKYICVTTEENINFQI